MSSAWCAVCRRARSSLVDVRAGRIVALVIGCLIGVIGLGVLAGGLVGTVAHATARDDDGFFRADAADLTTSTAGFASESVDLNRNVGWMTDRGDLATVSLSVQPGSSGKEIFTGIGPSADVAAYLSGVAYERLVDFSSSTDITLERQEGDASASPPGEQTFWVVETTTATAEPLTWTVESGDWTAVIMNADGSSGVDASVEVGVKIDWLLPVAIGAIIIGAILLAGGTLIAVFAVRGSRRDALPPPGGFTPSGAPADRPSGYPPPPGPAAP